MTRLILIAILVISSMGMVQDCLAKTSTNTWPVKVTPGDRSNGSIVSIQPTSGKKQDLPVKMYRLCYMSDGLEIIGFLAVPQTTTEKLPVAILNHGGCDNWSRIDGAWLDYMADVSLQGQFIVLSSQYRGIDGSQGRDEWGGADVNDVLNLFPLAKRISKADTSKIVMVGFSRGGTMTFEAIKAGAPLKAAVSVSGPVDLIRLYEARDLPMKDTLIGHLGGTPATSAESYKSRSAINWPEKLNVPVLILEGQLDDRVTTESAKELSAKLEKLAKPHKLVVVENGNHCINNKEEMRDQMILDWLKSHLN